MKGRAATAIMTRQRTETLEAIGAIRGRGERLTYEALQAEMGVSQGVAKARMATLRYLNLFAGAVSKQPRPRKPRREGRIPPPPELVDPARIVAVLAKCYEGMGDGRGEIDDPFDRRPARGNYRVHASAPPSTRAMVLDWKKRTGRIKPKPVPAEPVRFHAMKAPRHEESRRAMRFAPRGRRCGYTEVQVQKGAGD